MQKSQVQWLKKGDDNTLYFHVCLKARQSQNQINQLMRADGAAVQEPWQIGEEILTFFK